MQKILDMLLELLDGNGTGEANLDLSKIAHGIPDDAPLPDTLPPQAGGKPSWLTAPAEVAGEEPDTPEGVSVEHDMVFIEASVPDDLMYPSMVPDPVPAPDLSLPEDPGQPTTTPVIDVTGMPDLCEVTGLPTVALDALSSIVCPVETDDEENEDDLEFIA